MSLPLPSVPPVQYWPNFLSSAEADQLLSQSLDLPWEQHEITLFGRLHPVPRLEILVGDSSDYGYRYSGSVNLRAIPWPSFLMPLRDRIQLTTGYYYQVAMGNFYRTGQDSNGYHADDEPELGENPAIASLSLGASRTFRLKPKSEKGRSWAIALHHGDLLLMEPGCQAHWVHALPKTKRVQTHRINWTFRPSLF
jgi:alkylated DNA repair dioxygenase AlkB